MIMIPGDPIPHLSTLPFASPPNLKELLIPTHLRMFSVYFSSTHFGSECSVSLLVKGKGWGSMERLARGDWWTFPAFQKPQESWNSSKSHYCETHQMLIHKCIYSTCISQGKVVSLVSIPLNHSSKAAIFPSSSRSAQISSEEGEWSYTGCINISTPRLVDIHQVHLGEVFFELVNIHKKCF